MSTGVEDSVSIHHGSATETDHNQADALGRSPGKGLQSFSRAHMDIANPLIFFFSCFSLFRSINISTGFRHVSNR